uniref:WD_REPEATS_REGION domain-containing protein n=1 Tax=Rhabditophanes sp. KR3021 TaxID=114890 RepID=A0AC35TGP3_9BILA
MVELETTVIEENFIGADLAKFGAVIDDEDSYGYIISGNNVVVYECVKGKRVKILTHDAPVVGMNLGFQKLICYLQTGERIWWNLGDYSIELVTKLPINSIEWVYHVRGGTILLEKSATGEYLLYNTEGTNEEELQLLVTLPNKIDHPKNIALGEDYVVYAVHDTLTLVPFEDSKVPRSSIEVVLNFGESVIPDRLKFTELKIVADNLFAAHSLGRIYIWRQVKCAGLGKSNKYFFHAADNSLTFDVSEACNVYVGTAHSHLTKWNFLNEAGGRWQSKEAITHFEAPLKKVSLSVSCKICCVVLEDNSVIFCKTDSMTILGKGRTLLHSQFYPLHTMQVDPLNKDLIITDTRFGSIQWINPVKWQTIKTADIVLENSVARKIYCSDFEAVKSIVYLFTATPSYIVTAEKRSCEIKEVYIKFWRRQVKGKNNLLLQLEDVICVCEDITKITGELEKGAMFEESTLGSNNAHSNAEFLTSNSDGTINVWKGDAQRFGKWRKDTQRYGKWQGTEVVDITSIRGNVFASVHTSELISAHLILWSTTSMKILHFDNSLSQLHTIKWAPTEYQKYLLAGSAEYVGCFNVETLGYNWLVEQKGLFVYSDLNSAFAYDDKNILVFDVESGALTEKKNFKNAQSRMVCTLHGESRAYSGLSEEGFSLIKESDCLETNEEDNRIQAPKTAFSKLVEISRLHANKGKNSIVLFDNVRKAKELLNGPVFALAPLTQLAPLFINSCLIKKNVV